MADKPDPEWEEIRAVLRAVGERLDTVGERLDTVGRKQEENARQLDAQRVEADKRQEQADKRQEQADKRQEKLDRRLAKTELLIRELGKQIGGQGQRWGKIIESLVEGDLCTLMTDFLGIEIVDISRRVEVRDVEIDLVAVNTDTVVVVEVKTTLEQEHIDKFISNKLSRFTELRPHYRDSKIYGVIAFVKVESNAKEVIAYALSKGLIIIKAMRGTNHILNPKDSKPHDFHP